jgi:hypothetical protein
VSSPFLALDFDQGNLGLQDLLADPFIRANATFIYSTISYALDNRKWRVIFILTEAITDARVYNQAQTALLARFGTSDQSIKDPARFFYGSKPHTCIRYYLGNFLPMAQVLELVEEFAQARRTSDCELDRRSLSPIDPSQIKGDTRSQRYINRALQEELTWLQTRTEGTGERHLGLLTVARRLESLRLSHWLDAEARARIDVVSLVLGAADRNGYLAKYGKDDVMRALSWGIGVAEPRPLPPQWHSPKECPRSGERNATGLISDDLVVKLDRIDPEVCAFLSEAWQ